MTWHVEQAQTPPQACRGRLEPFGDVRMLPAGRCGRKDFFRIDLDGLAAGKTSLYIFSWRLYLTSSMYGLTSAHDLSPKMAR